MTSKTRSKSLREAVRELPCQFALFGRLCGAQDGTVVACHSNWQDLGDKGLATKADDRYIAAGCYRCHCELDQGHILSKAQRRAAWLAAHRRTIRLLVERGLWPDGLELPDA